MTTTILAHFDGKKSLVLDGPVDLPVGTPLRIHVEPLNERSADATRRSLRGVAKGMFELRDDFNDPLDCFTEYRR